LSGQRLPVVRQCTQHSALSTQHSALSTQHSALSTQYSVLSTQYSVEKHGLPLHVPHLGQVCVGVVQLVHVHAFDAFLSDADGCAGVAPVSQHHQAAELLAVCQPQGNAGVV